MFNDAPISPASLHGVRNLCGRTGTQIPLPSTGTQHTPALQGLDVLTIPVFLLPSFLFYTVSQVLCIKTDQLLEVYCRSLNLDSHTENQGFPGGSEVKASACKAGALGSSPGLGRSPGEGNGNPIQYSCLENSMDGGALWATVHGLVKGQTLLNDFTSLHRKPGNLQWGAPRALLMLTSQRTFQRTFENHS